MTSRRSSDRTVRADSPQRRPTVRRGIKKRGILPSFGDIVLPIVGVAAVGLLILAGRQFFLNGIKTSPGISSTRAYAESPALIAEREREQERKSEVTVSVPIAEEKNENSALDSIVKQDIAPSVSSVPDVRETPKTTLLNVSQTPPRKTPPVKTTQPQKTAPAVQTKAAQSPKTQPARTQPAKTQTVQPKKAETPKKTEKTAAVSSKPSSGQWRVQIGAYTSKAGAQEAVNKLKKAGYSAIVYSNPASKHHKVWVAGGADKKSAERVVNAMKKLGYGSSFAFPPAK